METAALVYNPPSVPQKLYWKAARYWATSCRQRKLDDAKMWSEMLHKCNKKTPGKHGGIIKECRRTSVSIVVAAHTLKAFVELTRGSVRKCVIKAECIFIRLSLQVGSLGPENDFKTRKMERTACCCLDFAPTSAWCSDHNYVWESGSKP